MTAVRARQRLARDRLRAYVAVEGSRTAAAAAAAAGATASSSAASATAACTGRHDRFARTQSNRARNRIERAIEGRARGAQSKARARNWRGRLGLTAPFRHVTTRLGSVVAARVQFRSASLVDVYSRRRVFTQRRHAAHPECAAAHVGKRESRYCRTRP